MAGAEVLNTKQQFQQCSKEEWAAWHADGPKRKEAKVDKTEEEEVDKEKEEGKTKEYWQGFYDGRACRKPCQVISDEIAQEEEDVFSLRCRQSKEYCKGFYDGRACRTYWKDASDEIAKEEAEVFGPVWVAREAALGAEFNRRVYGSKGKTNGFDRSAS
jgi:hypothetical protein